MWNLVLGEARCKGNSGNGYKICQTVVGKTRRCKILNEKIRDPDEVGGLHERIIVITPKWFGHLQRIVQIENVGRHANLVTRPKTRRAVKNKIWVRGEGQYESTETRSTKPEVVEGAWFADPYNDVLVQSRYFYTYRKHAVTCCAGKTLGDWPTNKHVLLRNICVSI